MRDAPLLSPKCPPPDPQIAGQRLPRVPGDGGSLLQILQHLPRCRHQGQRRRLLQRGAVPVPPSGCVSTVGFTRTTKWVRRSRQYCPATHEMRLNRRISSGAARQYRQVGASSSSVLPGERVSTVGFTSSTSKWVRRSRQYCPASASQPSDSP
eukprot:8304009-Pyramimonas_sp.AAC.1